MKKNLLQNLLVMAVCLLTFGAFAQDKGPENDRYPVSSTEAAPANDLCGDAIPVNVGDVVAGTTIDATLTGTPTFFCGTTISTAGVWYTIEGTDNDITLSTCDVADYDTKIHVFSGSCDGLVCVDGNDDNCPGFRSELTFASSCGELYYIYLSGFGGDTGNFELAVSGDPSSCEPAVPTLGEWGLIILALSMLIVGLVAITSRRPSLVKA